MNKLRKVCPTFTENEKSRLMEFTLNCLICKIFNHFSFYNVVYLSNLIHSKYLFKTLIQSFYIAVSHISIRELKADGSTRNKISAGVIKYPKA